MPLIKRKPVTPLPHPDALFDGSLPPDTEVFLLKATGELFLDYASYSQRMQFYLQKVFVDEYSGKSGIDYFEALDTEFEESKKTSDKFPDALKPKVLRACQFQLEGRQDKLGEAAYERFNNRYFLGEKVVVHHAIWPHGLDGPQTFQQYFGLVISVIPPPQIRALSLEAVERRKRKGNGQDILRLPGAPRALDEVFSNALFEATRDEAEVDAFAHLLGSRLDLDRLTAEAMDNPFEYTYIIRLMEGSQFHGTDMHVNCKALSRDRQSWNKNLIKRFIKESMTRENAVGAPWLIKRKLANLYKMPYELPESMQRKSDKMRDEVGNKRKKGGAGKRELDSPVLTQPRAKRVKSANDSTTMKDTSHLPLTEQPAHEVIPLRKNTKYPIEDLELDPRTILDGRILRSKHNELPALPSKPEPHRALPVPQEHFGAVLECWNFLSVFGGALALSPFSLDDFVHALLHNCLDPRCILLAEICATLSCNIAAEFGLRTAGTVSANVDALPYIIAHDLDNDGMTIQDREDWVLKALEYSRGWDRKARPKPADGRKGWELHLTGVLTQRGALSVMPSLPTILRHMFTAPVDVPTANGHSSPAPGESDDVKPEKAATTEITQETGVAQPDGPADPVKAEPESQTLLSNGPLSTNGATANGQPAAKAVHAVAEVKAEQSVTMQAEEVQDWEETDTPEPEARFLTLDLKYKLDILKWLIELNLGSKVVRAYVDLCESRLTDERKEKADMNKERRELLAEKALLEPSKFNKNKPKKDGDVSVAGAGEEAVATVTNGVATSGTNGTSMPATGTGSVKAEKLIVNGASTAPASAQASANGDAASSSPLSDHAPDADADMNGNGTFANGTTNGDIDMDESRAALTSMADAAEEEEVASDVDELESSSDEAPAMVAPTKKAQPKVKKEKEKTPVDRKTAIEEELKLIAQKEDAYDRDWRRHREVARAHPLGYDRFFHKYWWIDGIGDHDLVDSEGAITYGTGQLFVQGPSEIDQWEMCNRYPKDQDGAKLLAARRNHEESNNVRLGINEWAAYEDEEQINLLLQWLNDKGNRENALKKNILKWKEYIVEGTKARKSQLAAQPEVSPPSRRTRGARGRTAIDNSPAFHYLSYENLLGHQKAEDNRR